MRKTQLAFITFLSFLALLTSSLAGASEKQEGKWVIPIFSLPQELYLFGERVPLERMDVKESLDQALISAVYNPSQVILWIKRAHRYFPYLEKRLKERNLPEDLKYMVVVESAFRTYAVSSANAVGPWQFIKSTAQKYNLRVDKWIDERHNFEKATEAALNYLTDLYSMFNSWNLAVAAYNCGENKMGSSLSRQQSDNYFDTDLPLETEMYNFRIMAAKIILSQPEAYGYRIPTSLRYPPLKLETVEINLKAETPVLAIAQAAGTTFKLIKEMNPEILRYELPAGVYRIKVPPGAAGKVKAAFP